MSTRKKPQQPERHLQVQCFQYFRQQYPKLASLLIAIPNGGSRNKIEAANLKLQGVTAGVSDAVLFMPCIDMDKLQGRYHALCIEFKAGKGRQTENQNNWQQAVESFGYLYRVIYDFDRFKELIDNYIKGTI